MVSELKPRKELETGPRTDESAIDFEVKQVVDGLWVRVVLEEGERMNHGGLRAGEWESFKAGEG